MTVWQGDFGKGQNSGSGVWSDPGVNPCVLYGPAPAAGVSGQGVLNPPFRVGSVITGDIGSEFILGKLTLAGVTDLLPGQSYFIDKDFNLTLFSATNGSNVLNAEAGILNVWSPQTAVGTYYAWLQRAGHASVMAIAGSVSTGSAETCGTAGSVKFPASATASQKSVGPETAFVASSGVTFTATTTNGSPTLTNVSSITDLQLGQVITGTGLPANAIIAAIRKTGNTWSIDIGTNTAGSYATLQNCTATANTITMTVTSHVTANLYWPTLNKQN